MCINNLNNGNDSKSEKDMKNEISLLLKPSPNLRFLAIQFNNATPEENNIDSDIKNVVHPKFYVTEELRNMKITKKVNQCHYFI